MNFKILAVGIVFVFSSFGAFAQQELGLHFMQQIGQSSYTNPAFISDYKVGINLVSPYVNLSNTGFGIRDVLIEVPGTDSLRLDFDAAIAKMEPDNFTFLQYNIDVFLLTYQLKKLQLSLGYSIKSSAYANYPKSLIDIAWNGNSAYIGENVQLGPDFQSYLYHEISLGAAYKFDFGLSIGGRAKYLSGIADFSASKDHQSIELFTDDDIYQVTLNTDYIIQSSSFPELDEDFQVVDGQNFEVFPHPSNFPKNSGFSLDLGFNLNIGDRLSVAGSVIDLGGQINWKENLKNYVSLGEFSYEGIDISPLIQGDTLNFSAIGDTISNIFEIQTATNTQPYSSSLSTKYYLSASYDINDDLRIGGMVYNESYRGQNHPAFSIYGQMDFFKDILSVGVNYSYRNDRIYNIGLNTIVKAGPVQFFLASDNILPVFNPYKSRNVNLRAGLNLVFIKNKTETATGG